MIIPRFHSMIIGCLVFTSQLISAYTDNYFHSFGDNWFTLRGYSSTFHLPVPFANAFLYLVILRIADNEKNGLHNGL